jgi:flavin reductase (DIM6/NTAB) family NADH-FMN oxidoreductase RutF
VDSREYRRVVGQFPSGVVVVSSAEPSTGELHGVTINAFTSLSLEPPLILVCVNRAAQSHDFLTTRPHFAVNVLARRQIALAERFAGRAPLVGPEFADAPHTLGVGGAPLLRGSVAWLECRRTATHPGGDHSILVGEVLNATTGEDDDPLVYFNGTYAALAWG